MLLEADTEILLHDGKAVVHNEILMHDGEATFFPTDYFEADVDRSTCLHATSSRRESKTL